MEGAITKATTGIAKSALAVALERRGNQQQRVLLLDTSGSMNSEADVTGERRIDALRGVVESLRQQGVAFRTICFNSSPFFSDVIPEPSGGTNLSAALELAESINARHIVVVSDGVPDSKDAALTVASRLAARIDCYHVGPKAETEAANFLRELARNGGDAGGSVTFAELQVHIAGVLGTGKPQDDDKPIAL